MQRRLSPMEMSTWVKSWYCDSGACVEVQMTNRGMSIRNSTQPDVTVLCTMDEWDAFLKGVEAGQFTL
jgi:hypothetical protein